MSAESVRWHGWRYLVVFLLAAMVVAWRSPAAGAVLAAMGSIELAIGSLADACETLRHLFIFNTIWDLTLFAAVCAIPLSTRPINASPPAPGATRDP